MKSVKTFESLFNELVEKSTTRPSGSGTVAALDGGIHNLGKKIAEEAGEVWLAAEYQSDDELAEENFATNLLAAGHYGKTGSLLRRYLQIFVERVCRRR